MIVVDSSVWVDYFNGVGTRETALLDSILGLEPVVIGDLILAEVLQGFRTDRDMRRARATLNTLIFEPMVGRDIALASASNYRALRAKGVTVRKTIDMLRHAHRDLRYCLVLHSLIGKYNFLTL